MRVVIQRVTEAKVSINQKLVASINTGLLVLLGIVAEDDQDDIDWLCNKIVNLRIFADASGRMNNTIKQNLGSIIVVSQFTLHASTRKGNRPSYIKAAKPEVAIPLYKAFCKRLEEYFGQEIQTGEFGADMKVSLLNDGPVTLIIDSKSRE